MANWRATATEEQRQRFREAVSKWKKRMRENLSEEEKEKHINQLKENYKKWKENHTEESKKKFSDKMSKILKERWKNKDYRKYKSEATSAQMKRQWESYTDEEKEMKRKDIINKARQYRESLDEEWKKEYLNKMYEWRVKAANEREKNWLIKRPCQYPECILWAKANSWENIKWDKIFIDKWFYYQKEFSLWNYTYDFKIWNTLIEINPYAWHNSTWVPNIKWAKPKDKYYHYNKAKNAIDNWYWIIEVWDWVTKEDVFKAIEKWWNKNIWKPRLNWFNYKVWEHIIDNNYDKEEMISKWYVEIWDAWF